MEAQFIDDQYEDREEANRQAVADARASLSSIRREPEPRAEVLQRLSDRASAIQEAARRAVNEGRVVLTELSRYSNSGEISVRVKRVDPQQLIAAELLPTSAMKLVNAYIREGLDATKSERARVGLKPVINPETGSAEAEEVERIMQDVFKGNDIEMVEAYMGLVNATCIAAVIDPELHLYWSAKAKGSDPFGMVIDRLPEADRVAIFTWAMGQEDEAAAAVMPFRQEQTAAAGDVQPVEGRSGQAERADSV